MMKVPAGFPEVESGCRTPSKSKQHLMFLMEIMEVVGNER
jgi:hypothetical protein